MSPFGAFRSIQRMGLVDAHVFEQGGSAALRQNSGRGRVAAGDLGLFVFRQAFQDLRQDLARLGKCRLAVRIVRAPHHVVDANDVAQANADGVLLEA